MGTQTYVRDIASLRISDAEDAGGKGANLGELVAAGLPVPRGFVLMRAGYLDSMQAGGVSTELAALHRDGLTRTTDSERLDELCHRMRALVAKAGVNDAVRNQVLAAYQHLGNTVKVAVRSSATGEDGRDASFAGMNRTITNVAGEDALIDAVESCWASLFTPRVLTYRSSRGFSAHPAMAVVVQQMVAPEQAGVAFTKDPSTSEDHIVIEAALGQGEVVVSGKVQPDTYVVDRRTLQVVDSRIGCQDFKIVSGADGADKTVKLDPIQANSRVLDDDSLRRIAELAIAVERHHDCPQDVEWAISSGTTWLVQARPITALGGSAAADSRQHDVLARGLPAAPGSASGQVRVLMRPEDGKQLVTGEVLVAPMTNP
ncbi:MAG: phosphoenolpyruvate synthase, partial [Mycobacterium sp.]|nr:phosphoenolpyruvate synthase [Mycobacterium sp.]